MEKCINCIKWLLSCKHGHKITHLSLPLPVQPTEFIWAQVKMQIAKQNKTFKIKKNILHMPNEALDSVTA